MGCSKKPPGARYSLKYYVVYSLLLCREPSSGTGHDEKAAQGSTKVRVRIGARNGVMPSRDQ